jgi:exo-1,4-beta-D-glucosaminidase
VKKTVYLINHSLDKQGPRTIQIQTLDTAGKSLYNTTVRATTTPNTSKDIVSLAATALKDIKDVVFLRLVLVDDKGIVLSRNVYWVSKSIDVLDWDNSEWYSDYTALNKLATANVKASSRSGGSNGAATTTTTTVTLENMSQVPAFFVSLNLVDAKGEDVMPLTWSDNSVTLWPGEKLDLTVSPLAGAPAPAAVQIWGKNVARSVLKLV